MTRSNPSSFRKKNDRKHFFFAQKKKRFYFYFILGLFLKPKKPTFFLSLKLPKLDGFERGWMRAVQIRRDIEKILKIDKNRALFVHFQKSQKSCAAQTVKEIYQVFENVTLEYTFSLRSFDFPTGFLEIFLKPPVAKPHFSQGIS